jgi:hypothetical protein
METTTKASLKRVTRAESILAKANAQCLMKRRAEYRAEAVATSAARYVAAGWTEEEAKQAAERAFSARWVAMHILR